MTHLSPETAFLLRLALAVLASYRLARLIALDEGPKVPFSKNEMGILARLRGKLGAYDYGANGEAKTNLGRGIACPLCVGLYTMWPCSALALWSSWGGDVALILLGLAGAQAWLWSVSEGKN